MNVNSFLKQKRIDAGLSQGELASQLGYTSPQFVSNWERGLSLPPKGSMKKVCKILKLDYAAFVEDYVRLLLKRYEAEIRKSLI